MPPDTQIEGFIYNIYSYLSQCLLLSIMYLGASEIKQTHLFRICDAQY